MTRLLCITAALLLITSPAFSLDRTLIKDSRGKTVGGIVSKGGRSVIVDSEGHVVAVSVNKGGRTAVIAVQKPRSTCPGGVCPKMPSWKK